MNKITAATSYTEAPRPLRPLAKMLEGIGFQLAIPFDDIRKPGYIGVYDQGREIILDDGSSLTPYVRLKRRSVVLGDTRVISQFTLGSFLKSFGGLAGLNAVRTKSVSLRFPERFVPSEYISITDIVEDLDRLPEACRRVLRTPGSFVIVQTMETDSIEYLVESKTQLDAAAQESIFAEVEREASETTAEWQVRYESAKTYSLVVKGQAMTVAYKPYRLPAT